MSQFTFSDDPKGGVGMEIIARDRIVMFNSAVGALGALCLFMWNQDTVLAGRSASGLVWLGYPVNGYRSPLGQTRPPRRVLDGIDFG